MNTTEIIAMMEGKNTTINITLNEAVSKHGQLGFNVLSMGGLSVYIIAKFKPIGGYEQFVSGLMVKNQMPNLEIDSLGKVLYSHACQLEDTTILARPMSRVDYSLAVLDLVREAMQALHFRCTCNSVTNFTPDGNFEALLNTAKEPIISVLNILSNKHHSQAKSCISCG